MKIAQLIKEGNMFSEMHVIKVDPDRIDNHDLTNLLLPLITKMAYKNLHSDKEKHERKYGPKSNDEDAFNFEFTESALIDEIESALSNLAERFRDVSINELKDTIQAISKKFKEPLESEK